MIVLDKRVNFSSIWFGDFLVEFNFFRFQGFRQQNESNSKTLFDIMRIIVSAPFPHITRKRLQKCTFFKKGVELGNRSSFLILICQIIVFYFVVKIFVTTIWRHNRFLFICLCDFNWIACVTAFSTLSCKSFLFIRVIKFLITSLSKLTSAIQYRLFFALRDMVKLIHVFLIGGYLRAANRSSNKLNIFLFKI